MAVWPFTTINALRRERDALNNEVKAYETIRSDMTQRLARTEGSLRECRRALDHRDHEITQLKLQIDELRGQVHSATNRLARQAGALEAAQKNDARGAGGRYTKAKTSKPNPKPEA